ncbi:MAG TPA: DUF819 family protein [Sulfurimonas autotrophica]|uniref:DUF819 family protein n=1 Tax=Sulfurimonas autotrophica TaxID=202747 RepID=A0A7C3FY34_9BACT|nr:DUF819 family protein [Sulfurimonas autotrophica]
MISTPFAYLFVIALSVTFFHLLATRTRMRIFEYLPAVVMIYAFMMLLASLGVFHYNEAINNLYSQTKANLLPAMLFLMLLEIDLRHFLKLGKKLLLAYILAVGSIAVSFIVVAVLFHFNHDMAAAFGALAGSWMGGTANMVAVGSALDVSEDAFAYALVVDSVNYTLWVMLLLFLVPFAKVFNRFTKSEENLAYLSEIGCACAMGAKRYWLLIVLALVASLLSQLLANYFVIFNKTTSIVIIATLLGVVGSFTRLRELNGSSEVATTMLYILIALIGSKAVIESFSGLGFYVVAGFVILLIHAVLMVLGAKLFKLDLFSIAVASLANIGGVASAPILAATYDKKLVSIGVLMAIMGYLIGTFGGLFVGTLLVRFV